MTHLSRRPRGLLSVLQALTVCVMLVGTWFAACLGFFGVSAAQELLSGTVLVDARTCVVVFGALATVAAVSVCSYITLGSFLALLERMKRETAFTERNCAALGRMAGCCGVAAAILFVMMVYILGGVLAELESHDSLFAISFTAMLMVFPFGYGLVALMIQGVKVLMVRAMNLRKEQELVV